MALDTTHLHSDWLDAALCHRYTQLWAFLRLKRFLTPKELKLFIRRILQPRKAVLNWTLRPQCILPPWSLQAELCKGIYCIRAEMNKSPLPRQANCSREGQHVPGTGMGMGTARTCLQGDTSAGNLAVGWTNTYQNTDITNAGNLPRGRTNKCQNRDTDV